MALTTKAFLGVVAVHLIILNAFIFYPASAARRFEVSRVTTVNLVEPLEAEVRPAAMKAEPAPPPAAEPPPPPQAPPKPEPERPLPPPRVIRRVETIPAPKSDLKQRLTQRLSEIGTESSRQPAVAGDRRSAVSGDEKFPFGWYEDYLVRRFYELWEQPGRGAVKGDQASALVSFRIQRDGRIEGISLKKTSGSSLLDQSALEAVRKADPLPPLPEGFRGRWRDVNILFELTD